MLGNVRTMLRALEVFRSGSLKFSRGDYVVLGIEQLIRGFPVVRIHATVQLSVSVGEIFPAYVNCYNESVGLLLHFASPLVDTTLSAQVPETLRDEAKDEDEANQHRFLLYGYYPYRHPGAEP
jgi:hypothetical protein